MTLIKLLRHEIRRNSLLITCYINADSAPCVKNIQYLTYGECMTCCPRGELRFVEINNFPKKVS